MENYSHSLTNSLPPSKARRLNSDEESSWNFYIERFYCDDQTCFSNSDFGNTSSLLVGVGPKDGCFEKVSSKIRKRKRHLVYDDALEDTASSPVNTPKEQILSNNPAKIDEMIKELVAYGKNNTKITELKKKGLCLVPVSVVAKHIGIA